ncbi:MAG: tail fiber domain-containing protein [Chthoniobacterales bacterium]
MKTIIPFMRSINSVAALPVIALAIAWFALGQMAQAVSPPPDGGYPGDNTAEGQSALQRLTTGIQNTADGGYALYYNTTGNYNTATGYGALFLNTTGFSNTANGEFALSSNTTGNANVASGFEALNNNTTGIHNTANGSFALFSNTGAGDNTATGYGALYLNSAGRQNTATGTLALFSNTTGINNTAVGVSALQNNTTGSSNIAIGDQAGTGLGASVNHCIAIGVPGAGPFAALDNTCFIGSIFGEPVSDFGSQAQVYVDQFNVVGIMNSSRRYKHDIQPMDKASETLYRLKPVTFKFNSDWKGTTQYGLIAEEVAEVDPGLVARRDREIVTVHYEQINAMLLNEFLKEHGKVAKLEAALAEQQKRTTALLARVEQQEAKIEKVSAKLEMRAAGKKIALSEP